MYLKGSLALKIKQRRHLLVFRALQTLQRLIFRLELKISFVPETHEYLEQGTTPTEKIVRQNKII